MFHPTPKERIPLSIQRTVKGEEENRLDRVSGWYKSKTEPDCHHLSYGRSPLTADALKAYFQNGGYVLYTIGDLFNDYMHILSKRVGKDLTARSYRKYEIARDKFYQVISPKELVSAITKAVILDYQASMNQYLDYVTTNGYCQRVKTIVQFGIDNGKIKINPFSGIRLRRGEKSVQFLSEEEVEKIRSTDFHNESLNRVRDLCGIDKPIFSHVARHTYATRCLNRGIRLEVVAKLLKDNIINEVSDAFKKSY